MKLARTAFLVIVVAVLTACAEKRFVRPAGELLQLGKTTEDQVVAVMGLSDGLVFEKRNGKDIIANSYMNYPFTNKVLRRFAIFYFADGVLVGHMFASDFADESTDFDLTKVGSIVENKSTRQDVEALLGKPAGEAIYPFTSDQEGRVLWYFYVGSTARKSAEFVLDKHDTVRFFSVNEGGPFN